MDEQARPADILDIRFKGLIHPVQKRFGRGPFAISFTKEIIQASIRMILQTLPGERVMLPEFGSNLRKLLFDPNDAATKSLAQRYIQDSLARWEPRIERISVRVFQNENEINLEVVYRIVALSIEDAITLVFRREGQAA